MSFIQGFSKQVKQDDCYRWLAFGLIALAVLISYFPSVYYPPRADQVIYLSETANIHKSWDLIIGCYDHNRHRTIAPGDELLFRPLLYVFLGSEQVLFGHHFWAWQLTGILAHLILIWVLLRLLWRFSDPWLAFAGTWLFALAVFNYELVTWPHLTSYLLMMACVISAMEQVICSLEEGQVSSGRLIRLLIYSFIACFIYETANIFFLIMAAMLILSFPKMRWRFLVLVIPVILYLISSYINYTFIDHIHHIAGLTRQITIGQYLFAILYLSWWWLYQGLFNGMYHYNLALRTMFLPNEVMVFKPLVFNDPQIILELIILPVFVCLLWINRYQFLKRMGVLSAVLGMVFFYVAVIAIGRSHESGNLAEKVGINSYYSYIFWVFVVIIAFLSIANKNIKKQLQLWLIAVFVAASVFSGLWQGHKINEMAVEYSSHTNSIVLLVTTLDLLIQERKSEPDFSFYVDPDYQGNYTYGSIRKATDPPDKSYTFAEFLYPQYFRPKALAKYKFLARKPS